MANRLLLLIWLLSGLSWAHGIDDALIQLSQHDGQWSGVWRAPQVLFAGCDRDRDGIYRRQELEAGWQTLTVGKFFLKDSQGRTIPVLLAEGPILQSPGQLSLPIRFVCPPCPRLDLEYGLYLPGVSNQQCLAIMTGQQGSPRTLLLNPETPHQTSRWEPDPPTPGSPPAASQQSTFFHFLSLGVEHIWTGYDHLLFLLTLVVAGGSLLRWLQVITAFSVAHSISLALAVFGVLHASPSVVEPTIALSISVAAWVAFPGLAEQKMHHGWQLAFAFGLVHGLGFAGVLAELQLSGRQAIVPLVGFNLGVEFGQLCVALALLPIIRGLCHNRQGTRVRQVATVAAGLMGLFWFGERLLAPD